MPHPVHIVFSLPPASVGEEEYSSWYERHVAEILETPGFIAARRYWLGPASPDRPPVEFRHAVVYVMDRPSEEPLAELGRRQDAGELTIPDWFGEIRFASFDGRPLEDEELDPPDHGYLVLSHAPRRFTTEAYYGWYYAHARENLTSDRVRRGLALRAHSRDRRPGGARQRHARRVLRGPRRAARPAQRTGGLGPGTPRGHPRLDARGRVRVVGVPERGRDGYWALKPPSTPAWNRSRSVERSPAR